MREGPIDAEVRQLMDRPHTDTIRNLTQAADSGTSSFTKHLVTEEGQPYLSTVATGGYLDDVAGPGASSSSSNSGWQWNRRKYRVEGRALTDLVDALAKVCVRRCCVTFAGSSLARRTCNH